MAFNYHIWVGIILVIILGTSCSQENQKLLEPGISKELAVKRKQVIGDLSYSLFFDIPKEKSDKISGSVQISFTHQQPGEDLILDFNSDEGDIRSIYVNENKAELNYKNEHLIIDGSLIREKNVITIKFIAGEQSLNRKDDYLYTLFVPERASTCFPLFDQPDLKATYDLELLIPENWSAVANGALIKKEKLENQKRLSFQQTKPISSYLFAFAAGEFSSITTEKNDLQMTMYHRETDSAKVARNADQIFEWHTKSRDWLEQYTGTDLPFNKMDFILLPSFQYGGMEHPGAIFYKASSLFLDESASLNQKLGRARLIAHEVSHMWFGNLVTMKWFDDVWLKEVFANFMAAKIVNPEYPEINHDLKFLMSHYPSAYDVDRTMGTHPIMQELDNLKNAGSLYGSIIYQKAPIVMRMLEESIGMVQFQQGMKKYLQTYAYGNATWQNLLDILKETTEFNLEYWNASWVESAGMPDVFYVLIDGEEGKIEKLRLYNRIPGEESTVPWPQNLTLMLGTKDTSYMVKTPIRDRVDELIGNDLPDYLFTNAGGMGYGFFQVGPKSKKYYLENIDIAPDLSRAALWINYYEMMLREEIKPKLLFDAIIKSLPNEENKLITEYLLDRIEILFWKFLANEERVKVAPKLEGILLNLSIGTSDQDIKSSYFNTLRSIAITKSGTELLQNIWEGDMEVEGLTLSENDNIQLAQVLALKNEDDASRILSKQRDRIKNPDRKKRFEFVSQSIIPNKAERDKFFKSLAQPENRENEEWVLEALEYLHHPLRAESAIDYIEPSLNLLEEIKTTGDIFFPKRWLDQTLWGHSSHEADVIVRQFLYSHNDYPKDLKNKILQSADLLFRAVKVKEKYNNDDESS